METEVRNRKHAKNNATKANKTNVKQITSKEDVRESITQFNAKDNVWSGKESSADDCDTRVF